MFAIELHFVPKTIKNTSVGHSAAVGGMLRNYKSCKLQNTQKAESHHHFLHFVMQKYITQCSGEFLHFLKQQWSSVAQMINHMQNSDPLQFTVGFYVCIESFEINKNTEKHKPFLPLFK